MGTDLGGWLSAGLKTASDLTGRLKGLRETEKQFDQIELKKEIISASEEALALRDALLMAKENLAEQQAEIRRLTDELNHINQPIMVDGIYRKPLENGEASEVRVCRACWPVKGKLIPLVEQFNEGEFVCPNCGSHEIEKSSIDRWRAALRAPMQTRDWNPYE